MSAISLFSIPPSLHPSFIDGAGVRPQWPLGRSRSLLGIQSFTHFFSTHTPKYGGALESPLYLRCTESNPPHGLENMQAKHKR